MTGLPEKLSRVVPGRWGLDRGGWRFVDWWGWGFYGPAKRTTAPALGLLTSEMMVGGFRTEWVRATDMESSFWLWGGGGLEDIL